MSVNSFETGGEIKNNNQEILPPIELATSTPLAVAVQIHEVVFSGVSRLFDKVSSRLQSISSCASAQSIAPESPDSLAMHRAGQDAVRVSK